MEKLILDATCGSRMIWFDKENPIALYTDCREMDEQAIWRSGNGKSVRYCKVKPDIICDFTNLPFEDNSFHMVVFDPPHLKSLGETSWLYKKYGRLPENWQSLIHDGFKECMRVLKPYGSLIFKWSSVEIPLKEILNAIGYKPLFGSRGGKHMNTHWMCFMKLEEKLWKD